MNLLDLPSEVLRYILVFLDGESLISCCNASEVLDQEVNSIRNIWKRRCENEMTRAVFADTLIKNDPHGEGLTSSRWKSLYLQWVTPSLLFRHAFHVSWRRVGNSVSPDKMRIYHVTTHNTYVLVHWSNLNNFTWEFYCLVFDKNLKLVKSVETSSCRDFCTELSICSEALCDVVVKKSTSPLQRPFGCFSINFLDKSSDSLRQPKASAKVDFSFARSLFYTLKCYVTYSRRYGSVHLIGTDSGILFVIADPSANEDTFSLSPIATRVNTPCLPIISIDVFDSENEFVVVCCSHSFVARVSFPQT